MIIDIFIVFTLLYKLLMHFQRGPETNVYITFPHADHADAKKDEALGDTISLLFWGSVSSGTLSFFG